MVLSHDSSNQLPLLGFSSRFRRLGAGSSVSIWAPQPSENILPRALYSSSHAVQEEKPYFQRATSQQKFANPPLIAQEDVFGRLDVMFHSIKDVGVTSDARKKNTPEGGDTTIKQLLRTPHLNSPALEAGTTNLRYGLPQSSSLNISPFQSLFWPPTPVWYNLSYNYSFNASLCNSFSSWQLDYTSSSPHRVGTNEHPQMDWGLSQQPLTQQSATLKSGWCFPSEKPILGFNNLNQVDHIEPARTSIPNEQPSPPQQTSHKPINFLRLLYSSAEPEPPYHIFVSRIVESSDLQASVFLQQKLKISDSKERSKILDAICARGFELMMHRLGNWVVQRCLEAASTPKQRRNLVNCMKGRVVDVAQSCYGSYVVRKALDFEEDICLFIVSELLHNNPALTLVNKHASYIWIKIMEISWPLPVPSIFECVNKESLEGKWAYLACRKTGSPIIRRAIDKLEPKVKYRIVGELLKQGVAVFGQAVNNQWVPFCIQHILNSENYSYLALDRFLEGLLELATNKQRFNSVTKALKEGNKETLDRIIEYMCEQTRGARYPKVVRLCLSVAGCQLIAGVLLKAGKDQRALLRKCIMGHITAIRSREIRSRAIRLFNRLALARFCLGYPKEHTRGRLGL